MNLQAQIELINNPQEFTRLYNAVLQAEYGDAYLPIDDDRADRGNDGYLQSEKRMFAGHCFKRVQNQKLDKEITDKMVSDFNKVLVLNDRWDIEAWTFLSNYPINEGIAASIVARGKANNIDVSWRGPEYFAGMLQKHKYVREQFPDLIGDETMSQFSLVLDSLASLGAYPVPKNKRLGVPHTVEQQHKLLAMRPGGWEYLLFAGLLFQGKEGLELKWHDHEICYAVRNDRRFSNLQDVTRYLSSAMDDLMETTRRTMTVLDPQYQERVFGPPGTSGEPKRIEHAALRIVKYYEYLLDWAAEIRGGTFPKFVSRLVELMACMANNPINETRAFIDNVVVQTDQIPEYMASPRDQPLHITLKLELTIDQKIISEIAAETARLLKDMGR